MTFFLKRALFVAIFIIGLFVADAVYAVTTYRMNPNSISVINEHGQCSIVSNTDLRAIFVPTKTSSEWITFRAYKPANIVINLCYYGCTDGSANNYDSNANIDDGSCEYDPVCSTQSHSCSASYSGYGYALSRQVVTDTVYQSCDIAPSDYDALNIPPGTPTLQDRNYSSDCPQCWSDSHSYGGSSWSCSRSMGGYDYSNFRSTFDVSYYISCTISDSQKQDLQNQGYIYQTTERTYDGGYPGEWADTHYMSTCP
jgi:hypothetical protein